jgi:ABC-type transport system involved in multi-copper enzyme maturation permease subunit
MRGTWSIFTLTLREAQRRRLVIAALAVSVAFVLIYAVTLALVVRHGPCGQLGRPCRTPFDLARRTFAINMLTLAGLYVANFLSVIAAVLLPIDALSGDIESGVAQTVASKPIPRWNILFGKWLAHGLMLAAYLGLIAGGVVTAAWVVTRVISADGAGFLLPHVGQGLLLMLLEIAVTLTVAIAGGTRFSTITNGMVAFGIFGIGFLGGWLEQIGEFFAQTEAGRTAVRNVGTAISLASPADAIWRLAASHMMPSFASQLGLTPFVPLFPPTYAIAAWGAVYAAAVFVAGWRYFNRRPL